MPPSRWIYGLPGVWLAQTFAFTPVAFLVLIGVVEGVSPSLEEASQTLSAGPWATFARVTLPLALPGLAAGAVLAFARALGEFGATIVLADNVEGETRTIPVAGRSAIATFKAYMVNMLEGGFISEHVRLLRPRPVRSCRGARHGARRVPRQGPARA